MEKSESRPHRSPSASTECWQSLVHPQAPFDTRSVRSDRLLLPPLLPPPPLSVTSSPSTLSGCTGRQHQSHYAGFLTVLRHLPSPLHLLPLLSSINNPEHSSATLVPVSPGRFRPRRHHTGATNPLGSSSKQLDGGETRRTGRGIRLWRGGELGSSEEDLAMGRGTISLTS
jgi:hypothetical protein